MAARAAVAVAVAAAVVTRTATPLGPRRALLPLVASLARPLPPPTPAARLPQPPLLAVRGLSSKAKDAGPAKADRRDAYWYTQRVSALARGRQWAAAEDLLRTMHRRRVAEPQAAYRTVLDRCGEAGALRAAVSFIALMKKHGVPMDARTYTSAVRALALCAGKEDALDRAWALYEEMRGKGVPPTVYTYNALLYGVAGVHRGDLAALLSEHAKEDGVRLDSTSYDLLIRTSLRGDDIDGALLYFRDAAHAKQVRLAMARHQCDGGADSPLAGGRHPCCTRIQTGLNDITFNQVVTACAKRLDAPGGEERALDALRALLRPRRLGTRRKVNQQQRDRLIESAKRLARAVAARGPASATAVRSLLKLPITNNAVALRYALQKQTPRFGM